MPDREVLDRAGTSLPWYRKHLGVVMDWLEEQGIASCEVVTEADVQAFLKTAASRKSDPQGDLRDLDIAGQIFFDLMVSEEIIAEFQ